MAALLVALGASVGAPLRYLINHCLRLRWDTTPTTGTLTVNVIGSFILGLLAGGAIDGNWMALVGTGFCGALTTFSTLALELQDAFTDERPRDAVTNVALSLVLGVGAAWLGWILTS
ncbi:fluoride efflux transporter CrcB [Knoellia subterranea]|uniref:Fluoride-specific ion channel FluC n=1 Tax=Knoellia subterranea KCTC 19937 TaxID=1385521 RepID=A0A0A0JIL5_9MICO|nr:fluoride efflux transporter CrcB [Knoellia subterranea]KGN37255.1 chromosome condensation protein CrcB [Knoellia subterranea KCTC 19937]